jgi:hypothetical protein
LASVKVDFREGFKAISKFGEQGTKAAALELKNQVVKEISEGRSPVARAGGRFQKYSDSYQNAIDKGYYSKFNKRKRPVNLRLSGRLLKSIYTRTLDKNRVRIGFADQLADIHNRQGAGKSKVVRRMLPTNEGEKFTNTILFAVGVRLKRIARRLFK